MAIPDFQSIMVPLLKIASDGNEHSQSEAIELLAQQFELNEQDRKEMLPAENSANLIIELDGQKATYKKLIFSHLQEDQGSV